MDIGTEERREEKVHGAGRGDGERERRTNGVGGGAGGGGGEDRALFVHWTIF